MKILSINKHVEIKNHEVVTIAETEVKKMEGLEEFDYVIVNGGDGTLRRTIERIHKRKNLEKRPILIINPAGTFNVFFRVLKCENFEKIVEKIENNQPLCTDIRPYYSINNKKIFIFSAGNSLDVLYIACSELLRVGILKKSKMRYILSFLFLFPLILVTFPFFLINRHYYLVFSVVKLPFRRFFNMYFSLDKLSIDLKGTHTLMQLDGDTVIIKQGHIHVEQAGEVEVVVN